MEGPPRTPLRPVELQRLIIGLFQLVPDAKTQVRIIDVEVAREPEVDFSALAPVVKGTGVDGIGQVEKMPRAPRARFERWRGSR